MQLLSRAVIEAPVNIPASGWLAILSERPAWHRRAACFGLAMHPASVSGPLVERAKQVCHGCPVVEPCRMEGDALDRLGIDCGIRAGESEAERRARRRAASAVA